MSTPDRTLRAEVAQQLETLADNGSPLSATGNRATVHRPDLFDAAMVPEPRRRRVHREIIERYLARQSAVPRRCRAALLTAGPPGAGKTSALEAMEDVTNWRRLDADIVKNYLLAEVVTVGD